jgi:hypothetical protein
MTFWLRVNKASAKPVMITAQCGDKAHKKTAPKGAVENTQESGNPPLSENLGSDFINLTPTVGWKNARGHEAEAKETKRFSSFCDTEIGHFSPIRRTRF